MTVLLCLAGAMSLDGTVANQIATPSFPGEVRVAHPRGVSEADVSVGEDGDISAVSVTRTARRLLEGLAYLP